MDELRDLLRAIQARPNAARNLALTKLAYFTAARASEVCPLTVAQWTEGRGRGVLTFYRPKVADWHHAALHPEAVAAVERWLAARRSRDRSTVIDGPLFPSRGGAITPNGFWRFLKAAGADAGIPPHKCRPHVLRATRLTRLAEEGVPPLAIQDIAGHARYATTETYIRAAKGWSDRYNLQVGL